MNYDHAYTRLDRALHRLAFAGVGVQRSLSDLELAITERSRLSDVGSPVFITGLPRSGTTLLLELIAAVEGFGSHTYRDMPFVLCPVLWNRISSVFQRQAVPHERAHADAVETGFDSPEAFEETIWKAFWREKYEGNAIGIWHAADGNPEFLAFFRDHMRKIVTLRSSPARTVTRYVSKNNVNIARIDFLLHNVPNCRILVLFRKPADYVASTLRQHRRFLELHARSSFTLRYMDYLGHHEFGQTLKPIRFPGTATGDGADRAGFWLDYWVRAYDYVLDRADPRVVLVDYDRLASDPRPALEELAGTLELPSVESLVGQAARLRPATAYGPDAPLLNERLLRRADALHEALVQSASAS